MFILILVVFRFCFRKKYHSIQEQSNLLFESIATVIDEDLKLEQSRITSEIIY
jgi:hypothetical protein